MKVTLQLKEHDKKILRHISNNNKLDLTMNMCYNYGQYFKLFETNSQSKVITNTDLVLHAHLYDSTSTNNFWLILTNKIDMYDFCIPVNVQDNDFNNLNEMEVNLIKHVVNHK